MSYTTRLEPAGFHPKLIINYQGLSSVDCSLYIHLVVPPAFILDRFQITQSHDEHKLGSASMELLHPTLLITGERDLEIPINNANKTNMLMRLSGPSTTRKGKERAQEIEIPLHVRYQIPVVKRRITSGLPSDMLNLEIQPPTLFYACESPSMEKDLPTCPISSIDDDLSSLFPLSTTFHFLSLNTSLSLTDCEAIRHAPPLSISIPTGVVSDLPFVELINFVVVWGALLHLAWVSLKVRGRWTARKDGNKID